MEVYRHTDISSQLLIRVQLETRPRTSALFRLNGSHYRYRYIVCVMISLFQIMMYHHSDVLLHPCAGQTSKTSLRVRGQGVRQWDRLMFITRCSYFAYKLLSLFRLGVQHSANYNRLCTGSSFSTKGKIKLRPVSDTQRHPVFKNIFTPRQQNSVRGGAHKNDRTV